MYLPPLSRDALLHAYGVDCLIEEGKIIIIGTSIDDWPDSKIVIPTSNVEDSEENLKNTGTAATSEDSSEKRKSAASDAKNEKIVPWRRPKGWFQDRMVIKHFKR